MLELLRSDRDDHTRHPERSCAYTVLGSSPFPPGYTAGGYTYSAIGTAGNGDINSLSSGYVGLSITAVTSSVVPEPASVAMLGLGLLGVAGFAARRRVAR